MPTTQHTASYYAATARSSTPYPTLEGELSADVCVVGGGLTGVNTALELAEHGLSVILLEARRIGWGASGRNGGQLIRGIGHDVSGFARFVGQDGVRYLKQAGIDSVELVAIALPATASSATYAGASANWPTPPRSSPPSGRAGRSGRAGLPPRNPPGRPRANPRGGRQRPVRRRPGGHGLGSPASA